MTLIVRAWYHWCEKAIGGDNTAYDAVCLW